MALHEDLSGAVRLTLTHFRMTQADAAALIGLNRVQFSRRLSGVSPWSLQDLERIVQRYGIPADLLFAGGTAWIQHLDSTRSHPFRGGRMQATIQ